MWINVMFQLLKFFLESNYFVLWFISISAILHKATERKQLKLWESHQTIFLAKSLHSVCTFQCSKLPSVAFFSSPCMLQYSSRSPAISNKGLNFGLIQMKKHITVPPCSRYLVLLLVACFKIRGLLFVTEIPSSPYELLFLLFITTHQNILKYRDLKWIIFNFLWLRCQPFQHRLTFICFTGLV